MGCPTYRCKGSRGTHGKKSECTRGELFDKSGCQICTPCAPDPCPVLINCVVPDCPACSKLVTSTLPNGCKSCPECQFVKPPNTGCPLPKCRDPGCASYISYVNKRGCVICKLECQPSDACGIIECGECPSDCDTIPQFDSNGCKKCPICKKRKSKKCEPKICVQCVGEVTLDKNGCASCPICGTTPGQITSYRLIG